MTTNHRKLSWQSWQQMYDDQFQSAVEWRTKCDKAEARMNEMLARDQSFKKTVAQLKSEKSELISVLNDTKRRADDAERELARAHRALVAAMIGR